MTVAGIANPIVQNYKYDSLYRLTEAEVKNNTTEGAGQNWIQQFQYDRYGNRTAFNQSIGAVQTTATPLIDPATNRFVTTNQNFRYDKNGNLTTDGDGRTVIFNGENKQHEVKNASGQTIGRYFYDGEGKRVKKITWNSEGASETTIFVYSAGKLVAEYSNTQVPVPNRTTRYLTEDHLGTPRVITDSEGNVTSRRDFLPFGEEITPDIGARSSIAAYQPTTDNVKQKFTGYQKDEETGLDFAEARMYENRHGRFTAVDPLLASGKSANPQTFNRYIYCVNAPLSCTDPTGLDGTWYRKTEDKEVDGRICHCTTFQASPEHPGEGWDPVDFGGSSYLSVRTDAGLEFIYKDGHADLGERALEIQRSILSGVFNDNFEATRRFGWNSLAGVHNLGAGALNRLTWEYIFAGQVANRVYYVDYWQYENQDQANIGKLLEAAAIVVPAARASTLARSGTALESTNLLSTTNKTSPISSVSTVTRRPSHFRVGTVNAAWENAAPGPVGGRLCPTCGREIFWQKGRQRLGIWDVDHQPPWSLRNLTNLTRKEVLDEFNRGTRMDCVPCNRGRGNQFP